MIPVAEAIKLFLEEELAPYDCTVYITENAIIRERMGKTAIATNPLLAKMVAKYQRSVGEPADHIDIIARFNQPRYPFHDRENVAASIALCTTTLRLQVDVYRVRCDTSDPHRLGPASASHFYGDLNDPDVWDQIAQYLQQYRHWLSQEYEHTDRAHRGEILMIMQWAPLLPLFQDQGIIAMGPMQTGSGCIPHAIVLRALSNGVTVAPNASHPAEYAVHMVAISDINGQLEFTDGDYFDASTDQPAALALAWDKYEDRCRFNLGLPRK